MSQFEKVGIWILIAAAIILPLHELSDYTEVWPEDGSVVFLGLAFLLAGMAAISGIFFRKVSMAFVLACRLCVVVFVLPLRCISIWDSLIESAPPGKSLPFTFCDLRI